MTSQPRKWQRLPAIDRMIIGIEKRIKFRQAKISKLNIEVEEMKRIVLKLRK